MATPPKAENVKVEPEAEVAEVSGAAALTLLQAKASGAALPVDSNPITNEPAGLPDPKAAKVIEAAGEAAGSVKAQVLFARFNWYDGARIRYAERGSVVKLSGKLADHGEKIGALRRV